MSVPPGDLPPMDPLHLCYWVYVNRPDSVSIVIIPSLFVFIHLQKSSVNS